LLHASQAAEDGKFILHDSRRARTRPHRDCSGPEISLTPQTVERIKGRFAEAQDAVAVLHSHLSQGERHDEWHKIHSVARVL